MKDFALCHKQIFKAIITIGSLHIYVLDRPYVINTQKQTNFYVFIPKVF